MLPASLASGGAQAVSAKDVRELFPGFAPMNDDEDEEPDEEEDQDEDDDIDEGDYEEDDSDA